MNRTLTSGQVNLKKNQGLGNLGDQNNLEELSVDSDVLSYKDV